jgi:UDP-N-acetylglucosamine acyltransferase
MSDSSRQGEAIHPAAIIEPGAVLGAGVRVGPFSIIGAGAQIGADCEIGSHVRIESCVRLGPRCRIFQGAVLGSPPQDLKFHGEASELHIGADTMIREYATLNPGTGAGSATSVGEGCLLMAYVHVAHNCTIGNGVILANSVNLAGHVSVEEFASVGGVTPVHQFVRIGAHAFVGGGSRVPQDIPPFMRGAGNPLSIAGPNSVGLQRRGFSAASIQALHRAHRVLYRSGLNTSQALAQLEAELPDSAEVRQLVAFIRSSARGIVK